MFLTAELTLQPGFYFETKYHIAQAGLGTLHVMTDPLEQILPQVLRLDAYATIPAFM